MWLQPLTTNRYYEYNMCEVLPGPNRVNKKCLQSFNALFLPVEVKKGSCFHDKPLYSCLDTLFTTGYTIKAMARMPARNLLVMTFYVVDYCHAI